MSIDLNDVQEMAIQLAELHPDVDPRYVNFVTLRNWILALPDFDLEPGHIGEKVLEAVQAAWIEEL